MGKTEDNDLDQWYASKRPLYEALSIVVQSTIENLLRKANIDYLSVTRRAKTTESLLGKVARKTYKDPKQEITDFAGIRVITYIESDVSKVCDIIRSTFKVHPTESLDKSVELGIDRSGYRSVHFVCDLGTDRTKLPEFSSFEGLTFEVQVRTVLQHAWAEIEHDRNYKFSGVLPSHLQRRLNLLAGMLEMVDNEFVTLANEVDRYAEDVSEKAGSGNLDIEVNSTSLMQYLPEKLRWFERTNFRFTGREVSEEMIEELWSFGITTLAALDAVLTEELFDSVASHEYGTTYLGIMRDAMMYTDIDRYFDMAWNHSWGEIDRETLMFLSDKYGEDRVNELLSKHNIDIEEDPYYDDDYAIDERG